MDKELSKKLDRVIKLLEALVAQTSPKSGAGASDEVRRLVEQAEGGKPKRYEGLEKLLE